MISPALARPSSAFTLEMNRVPRHNARAMSWSVVVHLMLLLWLILHQTVVDKQPQLVEIAWLEAEPVAAAPTPATPEPNQPEPQKVETRVAPAPETQKFERRELVAEVEPIPQRADALTDQLQSLQSSLQSSRPDLAVATTPTKSRTKPSLSSVSKATPGPASLVRSDAHEGPVTPAELTREPTSRSRPSLAVAPESKTSPRTMEIAKPDENTARKVMDGAQLVGPVADRALISHPLPQYPAWAMQEAVEASVTLYFIVLPDGTVKANILVQKTSGHSDFDRNAEAALSKWRFEELPGSGEQWGTITFHFKLRDQ